MTNEERDANIVDALRARRNPSTFDTKDDIAAAILAAKAEAYDEATRIADEFKDSTAKAIGERIRALKASLDAETV